MPTLRATLVALTLACLAVVAVGTTTAAGEKVATALLLTGLTEYGEPEFSACTLPASAPAAGFAAVGAAALPTSPDALVGGAAWWALDAAETTAAIREFGVVGCTTVWRAGGRSVHVYPTTPLGCSATWSAAKERGGSVLTGSVPGAAEPLWELAFPAAGDTSPPRLTCAGFCPLVSNASPCTAAQVAGLRLPPQVAPAADAPAPPTAPLPVTSTSRRRLFQGGYGTTTPPPVTTTPPATTAPGPTPFNPAARLLEVARLQAQALNAQAQADADALLNEWRGVIDRRVG